MKPEDNYLQINKQSWNERTRVHLQSEFYDVAGFLEGKSSLNDIELRLLGDVQGKTVLHLQCHFGQDTLSLGRLGARATGVDLSDEAIASARSLAEKTGVDADFICCDIYDLPMHLDRQFDIVYTSYGVIGWLPDLDKWGRIVSKFLKPGGKFVFVEFHPVIWMFDNDFERITYRYFNSGPIVEKENGTYADKQADLQPETVTWNHSISDVINSLITNGLTIRLLEEFDYSPYNCFNKTIAAGPGKYRIAHLDDFIPMTYAIEAIKETH